MSAAWLVLLYSLLAVCLIQGHAVKLSTRLGDVTGTAVTVNGSLIHKYLGQSSTCLLYSYSCIDLTLYSGCLCRCPIRSASHRGAEATETEAVWKVWRSECHYIWLALSPME